MTELKDIVKEEDLIDEEEELHEHFRLTIDKGQAPLRIDKFLMNRIEGISRNKIQQAAEADSIIVNGKSVRSNYKIKPLDVVSIMLPEPKINFDLLPENIPLDIIYEDEDLVIVNKPAGLVVHPGCGNYTGTLVNGLVYHFNNLPSQVKNEFRPGLVHRIDKNTSGLLVIAKNEMAMTFLAKQFFDHTIQRTYKALVWGDVKPQEGSIKGHVGRNQRFRKIMDVFPEGEHGKEAVTHYKVLENLGYVSLLSCQLETGRTHQIRVHMKHIGHPVFNDETYGGDKIVKGTVYTKYRQFVENCFSIMPRHALHAQSLGFIHPRTKKKLFFESPLPADMQQVLEKWRNFINAK